MIVDVPIYYLDFSGSFEEQLRKEGLAATRIPPVDRSRLSKTRHKFRDGVSPEERARFLTHLKAIKRALDDDQQLVLILEGGCSFEYLRHQQVPLSEIPAKFPQYDIYQLSNVSDLRLNPRFANPITRGSPAAYLITRAGMDHLVEHQSSLTGSSRQNLFRHRAARVSRPYFAASRPVAGNARWDRYYGALQLWEQVYCINLASQIKHYKKMLSVCHQLNRSPEKFFHRGKFGNNYDLHPEDLVKLGLVDGSVLSSTRQLKPGEIGLNLTQIDLIRDAHRNGYGSALFLEDDVTLDRKFYDRLSQVADRIRDYDILFLGYSDHTNKKFFEALDEQIMVPARDKFLESGNRDFNLAGFFGVALSRKAIAILQREYSLINNISDIKLVTLAFGVRKDFSTGIDMCYPDPNNRHQLKVYYLDPPLIRADTRKASMTGCLRLPINLPNGSVYRYLNKTNRLGLKREGGLPLRVSLLPKAEEYNRRLIDLLLERNRLSVTSETDPLRSDLLFYTPFDRPQAKAYEQSRALLIEVSGEAVASSRADVVISTNLLDGVNQFQIYFPFLLQLIYEKFPDPRRLPQTPVDLSAKKKFCAYLYSYDVKHRVDLFRTVSLYRPVDALGISQHNVEGGTDRHHQSWMESAIAKFLPYKFVIAAENCFAPGYVTEKILLPCMANAVPIYLGSRRVLDFINPKRILLVRDYSMPELMARIREIDQSDELFREIVDQPWFASSQEVANREDALCQQFSRALGLAPRSILLTDRPLLCQKSSYDLVIKNGMEQFRRNYSVETLEELRTFLTDFVRPIDTIDLRFLRAMTVRSGKGPRPRPKPKPRPNPKKKDRVRATKKGK
jgi:GR25 family glycosyltransferase involved in LPS biosynthesis